MIRLHDTSLVFSASDITAHLACAHLEQQRLAVARGARGWPHAAVDAHLELVKRRGDRHEREQLARLTAEAGGDVADLTDDGLDVRDRAALVVSAARTAEAMAAGRALLFQPILFDGRWFGRADFLRRTAAGYEVLDTKLARQVKPAMVHQLALYARLAGALPTAYVILGDGRHEPVDLRRVAALHRRVAARVAGVQPRATFPERIGHCDVCAFAGECRAHRVAVDDLSLVAGARRDQRATLATRGVTTVAALATEPAGFPILQQQAALQVRSRDTGEPVHRHLPPERARGYAVLPAPSPGDVFFDLEGDPYALPDRGLEYLWGWWTEAGYEHLWAHDEAAEREALRRFVGVVRARLEQHPDMHVYHYAPHEKSTLRTLATRYATCEEEVDDLLRREVLVDLYAVVRQGVQVGEESYSIKALERHHGFRRLETTVREGGGSIVAYEAWLEGRDATLLEAIRAYNEEDCRSTLALRDWLWDRLRPEAEAQFGVDFAELREPEPETVRPAPAWLAEVEALADRLHAHDHDLLAYLLLYHRRESKPSWWHYFDLRGKTAEELVEERDAVGLLELDRSVEPWPVKRSLAWTLRFPPQEFKLSEGGAEDPTTDERYTVLQVEDEYLVLTRGAGSPAPEPRALASNSPIGAEAQRGALIELGESLLAGDGRFAAARALLDRTPPRDPRIEARLSGEVLPIQGPPGTGKTYRGARMIAAALRDGLRVGITAPSHAAIQNLLAAVEACADPFDGVYKGDGYHGGVDIAKDNGDVREEHRLVAGTAWLFARPEHRARFDLLFIDEAGQYSLADAVAVATAADSVVLLGDPQQLPQVTQADHPDGSGASVLEHLLDGHATIPPDRGVLLDETWRMHPDVCAFVSERSYEGRLHARPEGARRRIDPAGAGLRVLEVQHTGRSQASPEEAEAIAAECRALLDGSTVTDEHGETRPLAPADILVVAPYNLAVRMLRDRVPDGVRVGTVDRFQGQEAAVVFYAMTCSTGEDVPRGLEFLMSANRLNVAVSRAQCLAVLVLNPGLLDADCRTLEQMTLVDGACRFVEMAPG